MENIYQGQDNYINRFDLKFTQSENRKKRKNESIKKDID